MNMKQKIKIAVAVLVLFWVVALIQIIITRVYVEKTDFTQAFARNQIVVIGENEDSRNTEEGNQCIEGTYPGKMSQQKMEQVAEKMFQTMGGSTVMQSAIDTDQNYFVAYGFTNGLSDTKTVNGRKINLNAALSYDEKEDCTRVVLGTPLLNSDF